MNRYAYITKSNLGDPNVYSFVRRYLEAMGLDVLESPGGGENYNTQNIYTSDILVIIPRTLSFTNPNKSNQREIFMEFADYHGLPGKNVFVGKGQYTEIETFIAKEKEWMGKIFIVTDVDNGLSFSKFYPIKDNLMVYTESDADWKRKYALLNMGKVLSIQSNFDMLYTKETDENHERLIEVVQSVTAFMGTDSLRKKIVKEDDAYPFKTLLLRRKRKD